MPVTAQSAKSPVPELDIQDIERYRAVKLPIGEVIHVLADLKDVYSAGSTFSSYFSEQVKLLDRFAGEKLDPRVFAVGGKPPDETFLRGMDKLLSQGHSLSQALSHFTGSFPPFVLSMLAVAERTAEYDTILPMLVLFLEKVRKTRNDIIRFMTYPLIVLALGVAITGGIVWKIIPVFEEIFQSLLGEHAELPALTRWVVVGSHWCLNYGWLVVLGICMAWFIFSGSAKRTAMLGGWRDILLLKTPILGKYALAVECQNLFYSLAVQIKAGLGTSEAFYNAAAVVQNTVLRDDLLPAADAVLGGSPSAVSEACAKFSQHYFHSLSQPGRVLAHFESQGDDQVLFRYAAVLERRAEQHLQIIMTLIEPAMIVIIGVLIGVIVIALYLPLFTLIGNLAAQY